jgi:hypothetical protein
MRAAPLCGARPAAASGSGVRALLRASRSSFIFPPTRRSAFASQKPPLPPRSRFTASTARSRSLLAVSAAADGGERDGSGGGGAPQRPERRMDTHYTFTEELFTDAFQFVIPIYQRPYEWGPPELEQLMRDLEANLDANEQDVNELEVRARSRVGSGVRAVYTAARRHHDPKPSSARARTHARARRRTTWAR